MERGTGRTSKQMLDAPPGAFYVWPTGDLSYPRHLARHLGRTDLQLRSKGNLRYGAITRGSRVEVVVDHSVWVGRLSKQECEDLHVVSMHNEFIRSLKSCLADQLRKPSPA